MPPAGGADQRPDGTVELQRAGLSLPHRANVGRELAGAERLQPQSLTRILAPLEEQELINRTPDQADLRRSRLEITPLGVEVLRRNARHQEALAGPGDREKPELNRTRAVAVRRATA